MSGSLSTTTVPSFSPTHRRRDSTAPILPPCVAARRHAEIASANRRDTSGPRSDLRRADRDTIPGTGHATSSNTRARTHRSETTPSRHCRFRTAPVSEASEEIGVPRSRWIDRPAPRYRLRVAVEEQIGVQIGHDVHVRNVVQDVQRK